MNVWIALVESDKPFEFKFVICDSRFPIVEYTDGHAFLSNFAIKKFRNKSMEEIVLSYRDNIEMDNYKSMKIYNDDHAAEIIYKTGIEEKVADKTGLELI